MDESDELALINELFQFCCIYFLEHTGQDDIFLCNGFTKRFILEWTRQLWWVMTILWQTGRFRHDDGDRVKQFLLVCFLCVRIFVERWKCRLQYISSFSCTNTCWQWYVQPSRLCFAAGTEFEICVRDDSYLSSCWPKCPYSCKYSRLIVIRVPIN